MTKKIKTILASMLCVCMLFSIIPSFGIANAAANDGFIDFNEYESVEAILADTYYATSKLSDVNAAATSSDCSFSNDVYYNVTSVDGEDNCYPLSLSKAAISNLSDLSVNDPGYYIVYNVEPGSTFMLSTMYQQGFASAVDTKAASTGLDISWKFRLYYATDFNGEWTEITETEVAEGEDIPVGNFKYEVTEDVYGGRSAVSNYNTKYFDRQGYYSTILPENANFIRIAFPQQVNYNGGNTKINDRGYDQHGLISNIAFTPASNPADPYVRPVVAEYKTIDFANYENKAAEALNSAYDRTVITNDSFNSPVFDTNNYHADWKFMLGVSLQAVNALPKSLDTVEHFADESYFVDYADPDYGYYVTYNVEAGTNFKLHSLRKNGFWSQAEAKGYNWQFQFFASSDNENWEAVESEIVTTNINLGSDDGWNPYTLDDQYTVIVPADAKFIRVKFPQVRNLGSVFTWTNGWNVYGIIRDITYAPAITPADALAKEPAREYGKVIDMADESLSSADSLAAVLADMDSYSGKFNLGSNYAFYQKNQGDPWKRLLTLSEEAITDLAVNPTEYYISYKVAAGSSFRIQTLYRNNEARQFLSNGWSYRLKFYTSVDGFVWKEAEPTYFTEEGFATMMIDWWRGYHTMETYVVDIPENASYIKVVFPQDKSYPNNYGFSADQFCNWAIAAVKNISYTAQETAPEVDYTLGDCNFDGSVDIRDLVCLKNKLLAEKTFIPSDDLDKDGIVNSADAIQLKKYLFE